MLDNIKSLKEKLKQNVIRIKNFSEVDGLLYYFSNNSYVIFDSVSLKNYFINNTERCVINCNSSYDKFIDEMEKYYTEETIFNNINFCNDIAILNIVDKTNNLRLE